ETSGEDSRGFWEERRGASGEPSPLLRGSRVSPLLRTPRSPLGSPHFPLTLATPYWSRHFPLVSPLFYRFISMEPLPTPPIPADDPALVAAFEARIAAGESIEPKDWMPERYRRQLTR